MPSRTLMAVLVALVVTLPAQAASPLHEQIDKLVEARLGDVTPGPQADDAEFVRRVYLDLAGRIPTVAETLAFMADTSTSKRSDLIDRLLAGPDYPRRMQELFHAMLMERRGDNEDWVRFLRAAFEQNMPWDQMARSIIRPDAEDEQLRGAAYFFSARLVSEGAMAPVDVPALTRDVGRMFAGVDLQCAQCHDHISIEDYRQRDFQGLHMIFENVQTRRDVTFPAIAEKVMTEKKEFMSVFTGETRTTAPVVPGGGEIELKTFPKGEEFAVEPDRKTRAPGVPKFSPLTGLAEGLASKDNRLFRRNIVNRLWFAMMGRGLVEPLDLQHTANPPTHPELLDLLAREFTAQNFNIKWLIRELALTDAYQRTSAIPAGTEAPAGTTYALANEKRMSAEQLFWSTLIATGEFERRQAAAAKAEKGENSETKDDATELERLVASADEVANLQKEFLKTFANPPKEPEVDFEPTVKAALFVMHDGQILKLLAPREGNLVDRLLQMKTDQEVAEAAFLAIYSRRPTDEETADVAAFLNDHGDDRSKAVSQVAWALLASTEYCVNH